MSHYDSCFEITLPLPGVPIVREKFQYRRIEFPDEKNQVTDPLELHVDQAWMKRYHSLC